MMPSAGAVILACCVPCKWEGRLKTAGHAEGGALVLIGIGSFLGSLV